MKTQPALITPKVALWARKRAEVSHKQIAEKLRRKPDEIQSWESGSGQPTLRQAEKLAQTLRIPFGYLFLSEPPDEPVPLPDFRTMPKRGSGEAPVSLELREVLNDVLVKQDWYQTFLKEEGAELVPLVGRFNRDSDPEEIASYIRHELSIDDLIQKHASPSDFLRALIRRTESLGILVMVSGVVRNNNRRPLSPSDFRGFAISDPIAPLIFINGKDARAARLFTLVHELAHVAIGATGISNEPLRETQTLRHEIEVFCNKVAAEALVPKAEFLSVWDDDASIQTNFERLTRRYRVSSVVILRRAFDLGKISRSAFNHWYSIEEEKSKEPRLPSERGDFRLTLPARNSKTLTRAIVGAALDGNLSYREAARLLGVKVSTLLRIPEWLKASD